MEFKPLTITEEDVKQLRRLINVVNAGCFELKGDAVLVAASLFKWLYLLEGKFQCIINENKGIGKGKIKKLGETK